jgi:signal transduction histidine kinase
MAPGVPSDPSQLSPASPLRPQVASRRRLLASFFLLIVAVAATIGLFYRALVSVVDIEARVNQTYDVLAALDGALATLTDAETGQRGYLVTGRENYLEPYRVAVTSVGAHIADVRRLTQDNPRQQELTRQLAEKAGAKLEELERTVAAARSGKMDDAKAIVLSNDGQRLMEELRVLVASMKREEEARLAEQQDASRSSARRAKGTVFLAGGSLIGLLLLFYAQIRRADALGVRLLEAERVGRTQAEQVSASERRTRAELERVNQIKDQFLATVSHELRTPLNAMLGWSRMLRIADKPEMFARGLESIERNAKAQAQLVEDLLDVSRIIAGKMQLQAHPVDLRGVVRQAVDVVKPAADAKGIAITAECGADACRVNGDADRLQQIVWNLLSNAVKFTPPNGRVDITCTKAGSDAFVSVTDTGKGIPATFLPHLFEPFRQLDGSATRSEGGLGPAVRRGRDDARHRVDRARPGRGQVAGPVRRLFNARSEAG